MSLRQEFDNHVMTYDGSTSKALAIYLSYPSEQFLLDLIRGVQRSVNFVGPGMTVGLAKAISTAVRLQPTVDVSITIDLDPEVCRLGFGELAAVEKLESLTAQRPDILRQKTGLRLCVLTVDERMIVFPPAPRLIESPEAAPATISMTIPVAQPSGSYINKHLKTEVAPQPISARTIEALKQDLRENPPLPFDLSQKVRVFNSQFEFVEFELKGLALSRKRVPVPPSLMGLSKDPKAQKLLQSHFRLIGDDTELSSDVVLQLKKRLVERYLIILPNYGPVILRSHKPRFQRSVRLLKHYIARYQKKVERKLGEEIKKNREIIANMLFPLVRQNIPSDWRKFFSGSLTDANIRDRLNEELEDAFGQPAEHCQKMSCSAIFKGITYELLNDRQFVGIARKHIKSAIHLHKEYYAAKARSEQQ